MNVKSKSYLFSCLFLWASQTALAQEDAAGAENATMSEEEITRILSIADRATGESINGLTWKIDILSDSGDGDTSKQTLELKAVEGKWVAETTHPKRSRGQKLLKINENMWFTKPGLRKPVPISLRQRLTGGASNGDVASTRYAKDYDAMFLKNETVDGQDCYIFELRAKHNSVTYDRLKYWVSHESDLGVKAEFYSKTGKLLKSARFEHNNTLSHDGERLPFISEMMISDELTNDTSQFTYYDVRVTSVPAAEFRL